MKRVAGKRPDIAAIPLVLSPAIVGIEVTHAIVIAVDVEDVGNVVRVQLPDRPSRTPSPDRSKD